MGMTPAEGTDNPLSSVSNSDIPNVPFRVSSMTFNDGTKVDTGDADIVVLVGPNNVGKTRTLQEMEQFLKQDRVDPRGLYALSNISATKLMSSNQLEQWFTEHRLGLPDPGNPGRKIVYSFNVNTGSDAGQLQLAAHVQNWERQAPGSHLGHFAAHLVQALFVNQRLQGIPGAQRPEIGQPPRHPFHVLISNESLQRSFAEAFSRAFGMNIIMDG
jgi:hypothetical protein